jgi:hypothetical protein
MEILGLNNMHYPQEILSRYTAFYKAEYKRNIHDFTAVGCVKPLKIAMEIIEAAVKPIPFKGGI